jgi:hypothetical protein
VPLRATVGELVALLLMVTLPLAAPAAEGANCTFTEVLCVGARVTAPVPLRMEKPLPVALTPETATLELPVLVTVNPCEAVLPSLTLPKLILAGLKLSVRVAATPVPLSATVAGMLEALLVMLTVPLTEPAEAGAYCTLKLALWPGVKVAGRLRPLKVKPEPVTVADEIVKFAEPVLVTWKVCELALPTTTEPKAALAGVTLKPAWTPVPLSEATTLTPLLFVTLRVPADAPLELGA